MHECKILRIKVGNPADARTRNDKEEARRTHQERGRMEVGAEAEKEGRWRWRLRALVAGGSGFVGQSHVQASETVHPQPYREKKDTTRVDIHESSS